VETLKVKGNLHHLRTVSNFVQFSILSEHSLLILAYILY
jgi:hypothetical protein